MNKDFPDLIVYFGNKIISWERNVENPAIGSIIYPSYFAGGFRVVSKKAHRGHIEVTVEVWNDDR